MKKISLLVLMSFVSNIAFADCDWSRATKNTDGSYNYPKDLHICVGQLVQDNASLTDQVAKLDQAITLKDLAMTQSDARANLWMDTSGKLEDRVTKIDTIEKHNEFLFFGLGVLASIGVGIMTAKLIK